MAIGGSVSGYLWSWFDNSVNDFDCRLPGVEKRSKTKITPFKVQKGQLNSKSLSEGLIMLQIVVREERFSKQLVGHSLSTYLYVYRCYNFDVNTFD